MKFIERNKENKITAFFANPQYEGQESLSETDPEIVAWFAAEAQKRAAIEAEQAQKDQDIIDNLPSWAQVKAAIINAFPNSAQQNVMLKQARVIYWLAKNSEK